MKQSSSVIWKGEIQSGQGLISTDSGALKDIPYSYGTRFQGEKGANPEELIAAAHASCFTMALAGELGKSKIRPQSLTTKATVSLDKVNERWEITASHLEVVGVVSDVNQDKFREIAEIAKKNCPVSKLLKAEISMNAVLKES